jgi:type VI secretion system protein ImpK
MGKDAGPGPSGEERVVIRPRPGGRRSPPASRAPDPGEEADPDQTRLVRPTVTATIGTGAGAEAVLLPGEPLVAAASQLLHLLARIRNTAHQPDPGELYRGAMRALGAFERRATDTGVPAEQVHFAHYALCASIDDAVLNTPWGAASKWANSPLTVNLHEDANYNDRFFEQLEWLRRDAVKYLPVIEVMYLCLSLGFMGRYRRSPAGRDEVEELRAETCALIVKRRSPADRDPYSTELSEHWAGIDAPYQPSHGGLPVWVVYAAALAVCGAMFVWVSSTLNAASDEHYARMLAAPPGQMPVIARAAPVQPPVAPLQPNILDRLRSSLQADIDAGVVTVVGTPATPVFRIKNGGGFTAGSAVLQPGLAGVLERIGAVLKNEPGTVQVIAYTDNQPIRTVRFPSNFQLSDARAKAARAAIAHTVGDAARLRSEGRADADPVMPNATAEGREQNRRIEVVLHRPE